MGWRGVARDLVATANRIHRAEVRAQREAISAATQRRRELLAQQTQYERLEQRERAAHEAEVYENYIRLISCLHQTSSPTSDWKEVASRAPPVTPTRSARHEADARAAVESYRPSFSDIVMFRANGRRAALLVAVDAARNQDEAEHRSATRAYQDAKGSWDWLHRLANGVISLAPAAFRTVIDEVAAFDDVEECGTSVKVTEVAAEEIALRCHIGDSDVVPEEERKLTAAGKLSVKELPRNRYWALYQAHVCSVALRVSREAFALLPVRRVVVNVDARRFDSSTGRDAVGTLLAVSFGSQAFRHIDFQRVDPADAMQNFDHRMQFKKTTGFSPVDDMELSERWAEAVSRPRQ